MKFRHNKLDFEEACRINLDKLFDKYNILQDKLYNMNLHKELRASEIVEFYEKHFSRHELAVLYTLAEFYIAQHRMYKQFDIQKNMMAYG